MKIQRRLLLFAGYCLSVFTASFELKPLPSNAFPVPPCPPLHTRVGLICVPTAPPAPDKIPTNPKELSEEAWGQAGASVYRQGGEVLLARASGRGAVPRPLDDFQKQYLRSHFGSLVDNVVVFYNVPPLDYWEILNVRLKNSDTVAQTFCERIFVRDNYRSRDRDQLITLAHELVHSQQCQRFGGAEKFGYQYFKAFKKANLDYNNISLEQEAYAFQARFDGGLGSLASLNSLVDLINRIKSGTVFRVSFDKVGGKFNDSGWTGNTDPMGTLKAGETYQVTYSGSKYTTRGFSEGTNSVISATYGNANPDEGKISLWGRVYTFDASGNVYDPQFGLVGTLRF